jgi:hypothetical protein
MEKEVYHSFETGIRSSYKYQKHILAQSIKENDNMQKAERVFD